MVLEMVSKGLKLTSMRTQSSALSWLDDGLSLAKYEKLIFEPYRIRCEELNCHGPDTLTEAYREKSFEFFGCCLSRGGRAFAFRVACSCPVPGK